MPMLYQYFVHVASSEPAFWRMQRRRSLARLVHASVDAWIGVRLLNQLSAAADVRDAVMMFLLHIMCKC